MAGCEGALAELFAVRRRKRPVSVLAGKRHRLRYIAQNAPPGRYGLAGNTMIARDVAVGDGPRRGLPAAGEERTNSADPEKG